MGFEQISDEYPWDSIADYKRRASAHPGGHIDLSIGTPVDPTPAVLTEALDQAADAYGYPTTQGSVAARTAVAEWFARRRGVPSLDAADVTLTIGSKEAVGLLPSLLGLGGGDVVVHPAIAYPTYDVGARMAGAVALATDNIADWAGRSDVRLVWVNSPANPHGAVLGVDELREVVAAARKIGAVVASDECYAELVWDRDDSPSILDPRVSDGDHQGLLALYSLSKQSNAAGYRAAVIAGDRSLVDHVVRLRKHLGLIVPTPIQAALAAAFADDDHVAAQRAVYERRRTHLMEALTGAGLSIEHSEAGLYLWVTHGDADMDCWGLMSWFADRGIIVGPGVFYGPGGARHVRVSVTASDTSIAEAAVRLS